MLRRGVATLFVAAILGALSHGEVLAHSGLRLSDPIAGVTLGDTPKAVRLSFSERPEASLSSIQVLDTRGTACQIGQPEPVAGDPLSLSVRVRPLDRGVYTVSWRVVSAVDGHATAGGYAFGVLVPPTGPAASTPVTNGAASPLEMLARCILITGLVVLLGAATAAVARFGGPGDLPLGAGGWILAIFGLFLLAEAQRRNASASFASLLGTSVGRALIWRAIAIGAAGAALLVARRAPVRAYRGAMTGVALAVMAGVAVHVAAGHAAAAGWLTAAVVGAQWTHFTAAGIWLGGLAALLLGLRGAPSAARAQAARRFSKIATAGLIVVVATGAVRALGELSSWGELIFTGYGRIVSAKIALTIAIAALGALNHWRNVPAAATRLSPLRRTGIGELALAAGALAASAVLGSLPTPAAALRDAPPRLIASAADFGTTVQVQLTTVSDQPGPNRFVVHAVDYDSNAPVRAKRVSLRFAPLDDPGVESTILLLAKGPGDSYVGSGANLSFDGRWRVTVLIERSGDSVEVPLELETRIAPKSVAVVRIPGKNPVYSVELLSGQFMRFSPNPERAGPSEVIVTCFDLLLEEQGIEQIVVTTSAGKDPPSQRPVRRLGIGRFAADVDLRPGRNTIAAVARALDGGRLRAAVEVEVPER